MELFKKLFRRKIDPNAHLRKLEKLKIKIEKKIEGFSRLKERVREGTKKKIEEGMNKLKKEKEGVIETIKKLKEK